MKNPIKDIDFYLGGRDIRGGSFNESPFWGVGTGTPAKLSNAHRDAMSKRVSDWEGRKIGFRVMRNGR